MVNLETYLQDPNFRPSMSFQHLVDHAYNILQKVAKEKSPQILSEVCLEVKKKCVGYRTLE